MQRFKKGDKVKVMPYNPNHWSKRLYKWIYGRKGMVYEVKNHPDGGYFYVVEFNSGVKAYDYGTECNFWHCFTEDLIPWEE